MADKRVRGGTFDGYDAEALIQSIEQLRTAENCISGSMNWSDTPQGGQYWATVENNLAKVREEAQYEYRQLMGVPYIPADDATSNDQAAANRTSEIKEAAEALRARMAKIPS